MLFHRIRSSRPGIRMLAGTVLAVGVVAGSATAAVATPAHQGGSVRSTSSFVAFTKQNFGGSRHTLTGCGGHNIPTPLGSWKVFYSGKEIRMYNHVNEGGTVVFRFDGNSSSRQGAGWKSLLVAC
jgi:hypothetical protein